MLDENMMRILTLGIILQWPKYFQNFVLYKQLEFQSLELGSSYKENHKNFFFFLHVSNSPNSISMLEQLFSVLQIGRVDKTKNKVRSSRKWTNSVLLLWVYFWQRSFKKYLNSSLLDICQKRKEVIIKQVPQDEMNSFPPFWISCNPIILPKLVLW